MAASSLAVRATRFGCPAANKVLKRVPCLAHEPNTLCEKVHRHTRNDLSASVTRWPDGAIRDPSSSTFVPLQKNTTDGIMKTMNKKQISEVMRYLGSQKSKAKAVAARKNGKLGGRPKGSTKR
jgi:hypothetical protein